MSNARPLHTSYTPEAIRSQLNTLILGRRIELRQRVGSTNDLAREAGRRGEPEGFVALAEEQLAGRGRLGRAWIAPPGSSILCSVLLRPHFSSEHAFYLTIIASLAIYHAVREQLRGLDLEALTTIKWPNDVLIGGRKVSGVLSESEFNGGEWTFAVVGLGINVNARAAHLPSTATWVSAAAGQPVDRARLLARTLEEFESLYLSLQNGQFGHAHGRWAAALETVGKRVSVHEPGGMVTGLAVRVDADGALVIRTESGEEQRVLAGDVLSSVMSLGREADACN